MHNLYLGLLERHIRDFWGIHTKLDDGDGTGQDSVKAPPRPSQTVMSTGLDCLLHGSDSELEACGRPVLYHLCLEHNVRRTGTKRMLARHLFAWRRKEGLRVPRESAYKPPVAQYKDLSQLDDTGTVSKLVGSGAVVLERAKSSDALVRRGLLVLQEMCRIRKLPTEGRRAILAA
ncbi:hypothetical protein C8Q74DRAFT_322501 [Fomes fomentarius]|nr:hypothetical protein C8Q74DRAFT_322501 [Fomes fomentarius]